ncbi:NAD(+) synthase [Chloroflexota bacterium]
MQTAKVLDHIVSWLKSYCENAGSKGFVVGVSGGIDSAVVSTLCARTGKAVLLLNLPISQAPKQLSLAEQHIDWLEREFDQAKGIKVKLTPVLQALGRSLPSDIQDGLTMANTRARIRMATLYAFASHHKMLVAGTGNKIEDFGVGFYTKYGDGGVDLSPIADLVKSEVYAIGKELGIIEAIVNAPPTDGLWGDNRTDEDQIGATYPELEWAMEFEANPRVEGRLSARQKEVLNIYRKHHEANRHKMVPIPVCKIPGSLR